MRSPLLDLPGAVPDEFDEDVPARFDDFSGEQWQLEAGQALSDLSDLGVVQVSGPDRLSWLTTISSQVVNPLPPGESRELLLLDPNGRISFAIAIIDDGQVATLLVEGAKAGDLTEFLGRMQFMLRVEVRNVTSEVAIVGSMVKTDADDWHRVANEVVPDLPGYLFTWVDPWPGVTEGGASYTPQGFAHPAQGRTRALHGVDRAQLTEFASAWAKRGSWAGRNAWEALRIEDLRPRFGREVDEKTVPHELDWLRTAVHLNKGCYSGQESVARIVNMGKPPRRLVLLQLDGSQSRVVKPGADVVLNNRRVGQVTSVARHADWGPIALAVIRRAIPLDAQLDVQTSEGEVAAAQEVVVDPLGRSSASPKERPGEELRKARREMPGVANPGTPGGFGIGGRSL
ncbi:glycine cleavage T C-terminal barrel domain-containing protein [uncultured Actinomyces sp.]|uniref:CAF17-like 4Fe-4S cluster assembly/insertion protein YgfZ n=1 Tax=uncultured Actinomyces sp. TaxID=249061 RepID=UPI00263857B2|nr:glycine cleavage T C-terminal barrel domain-containing protein [uncultured Actinomyces sp.]